MVFPRDADITTFPNYHEDMSALEFFSQVYPHIGTSHAHSQTRPNLVRNRLTAKAQTRDGR